MTRQALQVRNFSRAIDRLLFAALACSVALSCVSTQTAEQSVLAQYMAVGESDRFTLKFVKQ